jgi:acyl-CoA synthetase (AMP-forming)/AMP-acid ligase II
MLLTGGRVRLLLRKTIRRASLELGAQAIEKLRRAAPGAVEPSTDDLALIQFSSGTLAEPKPVRLTHRGILANVEAIRAAILAAYPEGPGLGHLGVSWLPLYHDMGLIGAVFTALIHPSDLILIPPEVFVARPSIWLRTISRYSATVSAAPNFAYSLCADRIVDVEMEGVDLTSWRLAMNGGEPVTPSVLSRFSQRFRSFGFREEALTPVYGLAEAALAVTFSDPPTRYLCRSFDRDLLAGDGVARLAPQGRQLVSVGKPLPDYGVRIVDDEGVTLPEGRTGRVLVSGPSLMEGYHGAAEATAEVLRGDWLDTGDTGFIHDGDLFLCGRKKDLIIVRGRNYAPEDIEQCLYEVPGLRRGCWAAVGVVREDGDGEELFVLVERSRRGKKAGDRDLAEAVSKKVTERTGLVPGKVPVLEPGTLPRTSSGKIRRQHCYDGAR